jgi:multidrug transporter EmrE-like cation transporter
MAFLVLTLKDKTNRWTNIILGIVFTVLNIVHLIMHFTLVPLTVHQVLIVGSTVVFTALIAWYAWKWK